MSVRVVTSFGVHADEGCWVEHALHELRRDVEAVLTTRHNDFVQRLQRSQARERAQSTRTAGTTVTVETVETHHSSYPSQGASEAAIAVFESSGAIGATQEASWSRCESPGSPARASGPWSPSYELMPPDGYTSQGTAHGVPITPASANPASGSQLRGASTLGTLWSSQFTLATKVGNAASAGEPPATISEAGEESRRTAMGSDSNLARKLTRVHTVVNDIIASEALVQAPAQTWRKKSREYLGWWLDLLSWFIITSNIVVLAVQFEYRGFDLLHAVEPNGHRPAVEAWPGADRVFDVLEWGFGAWFALELLLRVVCRINLRQECLFNLLDLMIVLAWGLERLGDLMTSWDFNPTLLRMVRLVRLARFAKLLRNVKFMDPLYLIVKAIQSSMSVLLWAVAILGVLMTMVAMFNSSILDSFIVDTEQDHEARMEVYNNWGSFMRAFTSMFEITLANWGPQCWLLMNRVDEKWGFFFIFWRCCFGFAVVQVITSVFIQHTFAVANRDEDIMIKQKEQAAKAYLKHLDNLFSMLDDSGDGLVSEDEFLLALEDARVRHWFAALELDVNKLPEIFRMLANDQGYISKDEFIDGLKQCKGQAQRMDLLALRKEVHKLLGMLMGYGIRKVDSIEALTQLRKSDMLGAPSMDRRTAAAESQSSARVSPLSMQASCLGLQEVDEEFDRLIEELRVDADAAGGADAQLGVAAAASDAPGRPTAPRLGNRE